MPIDRKETILVSQNNTVSEPVGLKEYAVHLSVCSSKYRSADPPRDVHTVVQSESMSERVFLESKNPRYVSLPTVNGPKGWNIVEQILLRFQKCGHLGYRFCGVLEIRLQAAQLANLFRGSLFNGFNTQE